MRRTGWFVLGVLCSLAVGSQAGTYYVAPNGNNANPGTIDLPWRTIAKANADLRPGDTVYIRGGTYPEQIRPVREGSAGNPIVYAAQPGEEVIITGLASSLAVVILPSYTVAEGFTIKSQAYLRILNTKDYWVHLLGNHITLRRCRIIADGDPRSNYWDLGAHSRGVVVAGQHNVVEHCFIRGQQMGLVIAGGLPRYTILRFDTLYNHGASNIVVLSHEDNSTFDRQLQRTLIEDCVIDTSWEEDNIQFEPNYLDHGQTYNLGTIIRRSRLGNAAENCIDFKGAEAVLVDSCLLYGSEGDDNGRWDGPDDHGGAGLELGAEDVSRYVIVRRSVIWDNHTGAHMYDGYRYYNNVFLNNRKSYRGSNGTHAGNDFAGAAIWNKPALDRAFVNNIIGMQPNKAVLTWWMDFGGRFTLNNNLYYDDTGPAKFFMEMPEGMVIKAGLAAWRDALTTYAGYAYLGGKDQQSIEADPRFVNVPLYPTGYDESWNFGYLPSSPAIDAGRPVTVTVNAAGGGTTLRVADARFFCDGFGITDGDLIMIGSEPAVHITGIDPETNTITLAEPRSWGAGEGVHLAYEGSAPDIGAIEYVAGSQQAPATPQPDAPVDGATNLDLTVEIIWSSVPGAVRYYPQVAANRNFTSLVLTPGGVPGTSYTATGLSGNATYYWRVRAGNDGGLSGWSAVRSFTTRTVGNVPAPPTTAAPAGGAQDVSTNPYLTWNASANATSYAIQVAANPSFAAILVDRSGITGTGTAVDGLQGGATYYWRVNATGSGGTGAWSFPSSFTTFSPPVLIAGNQIPNPDFEAGTSGWAFYTNGVASFGLSPRGYQNTTAAEITISQDGFNTQLYRNNLLLVPDSTYRLTFAAMSSSGNDCDVSFLKGVFPFTGYGLTSEKIDLTPSWRLFSLDFSPKNFAAPVNDVRLRFAFGGYSAPGDVYRIDHISLTPINASTPPPPVDIPPPDFFLEENYPNPFNPATTIRYTLPRDVRVTLLVVNVLGQEIMRLVDEYQSAGTHDVVLDLQGYAAGMYLYVLQAGDYRQTRKLMYIK